MIKEKIYYLIEVKSQAPLSVGNGKDELTDHDLIRDSDGVPFIPATSIVGSCLHYLSKEEQDIVNPKKAGEKILSPFFISDAMLINKVKTSVRDGIKVDENKITVDGAKYNMEIIEYGTDFRFRIEITVRDNDDSKKMQEIVNKILANIDKGNILFGMKSKRGFGKVKIEKAFRRSFKKENLDELIEFKKYSSDSYEEYEINYDCIYDKLDTIEVNLTQLGGISIRSYSAKAGDIDFEHIKSNNIPVIPGTSWNGAIRKQVEYYNYKFEEQGFKYDTSKWFGFSENKKAQASNIIIEESIIEEGKEITLARNKIDRFSGGSADSALFNEKAWFNGNTRLTIKVAKEVNGEKNDYILGLILLTIKDIENGLIALGGQTAIGRGIFEVNDIKLNGDKINVDKFISKLASIAKVGGGI